MLLPWHLFNFLRIELRRRKSKKRGGKFKLKIGRVADFFRELDRLKIEYVVLRWFEEVPLTPEDEKTTTKDIDILFRDSDLKKVMRIGARFPGNVLAEFYSVSGKRGTSARGYPYYPPALAEQIITHREQYRNHFYIPSPREHFQSLCYHLVYHKGYDSGLPINSSEPLRATSSRDYQSLLSEFSGEIDLKLEQTITLESLYRHLVATHWTMPYDLKLRWRFCQKEWLEHLCRLEEESDFTYADKLPGLIVFLIREDGSSSPEILATTVRKIEERFEVTHTIHLNEEQKKRVLHNVRGGNWLEYRDKIPVPPTIALICFDPSPELLTKDHPSFKKYPLITNLNVLVKNKIRSQINEKFPLNKKIRTVLHSSDNTMEAHHHLFYVLGREAYPTFCEDLLKRELPEETTS